MAKSKVNGKSDRASKLAKRTVSKPRAGKAKSRRFSPGEGQSSVLQWLLSKRAFSKENARPKGEGVEAGCMEYNWDGLRDKGLIAYVNDDRFGRSGWGAYLTKEGKKAAESARYKKVLDDVNSLSLEDRARLVRDVSPRIKAEQTRCELSEELKQELSRRIADMEAAPDDELSWEEAETEIRAELSK